MFHKGNKKKREIIDDIKQLLEKSKYSCAILKFTSAATCEEINKIRREAHKRKVVLQKFPNKVFRTALEKENIKNDNLSALLKKDNLVVFSEETITSANFSESLPRDLRKKVELIATIDEKNIITDTMTLKTIAALPNKNSLMAGLVATLNSPIMMLLRTLEAKIKMNENK